MFICTAVLKKSRAPVGRPWVRGWVLLVRLSVLELGRLTAWLESGSKPGARRARFQKSMGMGSAWNSASNFDGTALPATMRASYWLAIPGGLGRVAGGSANS